MADPTPVTIGNPTKKSEIDALAFRTMTAGAGGIAAYDVVYPSASDTVLKAKANAAGTMPAIGIAIAAISAAATGSIQHQGTTTNGSWAWTAGQVLYVSAATAGALTATRPTGANIAQPVAIALTATTILLLFSDDLDPTKISETPGANKIPRANVSGKLAAGWGGDAGSLATLTGSALVNENPANATATPTANKIPIADGSGFLDNNWLGNLRRGNWVRNAQFDMWEGGTAVAPDWWTFSGNAVARQASSYIKYGPYSCKLTTSVGVDTYIQQNLMPYPFYDSTYPGGKTFTLASDVFCETANKAYIFIHDGFTETRVYHTGTGWERLKVTKTLNAGTTQILLTLGIFDVAGSAWFDGVSFVEGDQDFGYSPSSYDGMLVHVENLEISATTTGVQSITGLPRRPKLVWVMAGVGTTGGANSEGGSIGMDGPHRPAERIMFNQETGWTDMPFRIQGNDELYWRADATGANVKKGTGLTFNNDGITWTNTNAAGAGLNTYLRLIFWM